MSFSKDVKKELINIEVTNECCKKAMTYGLLLFGRSFNIKGISMMTDSDDTAYIYKTMIESTAGVSVNDEVTDSGKHILSVVKKEDREKIFSFFNLTGNEPSLRINRAILTNESDDELNCCFSSFVRGAFISCGTVCDPNKMYTLEFVVPFLRLSEDLKALLSEMKLEPKTASRRGVRVVYFKDSTQIEDILTTMGAMNSSLTLMGIKVLKDVKNRVNRRTNFDNANISRMVNASMVQIKEIEFIDETIGLSTLKPDLQEMAAIRIENPEMSLTEMGELFNPSITRSGVNYKLQKLMSIAKNLRSEQEN